MVSEAHTCEIIVYRDDLVRRVQEGHAQAAQARGVGVSHRGLSACHHALFCGHGGVT